MDDMSFAKYILSEKRISEKMKIILYLKRKHEIFFDNSVIFKTEVARMFLEGNRIPEIDSNLLLTACLLYGCKKSVISFDLEKVKTYAQEGAKYLATLGFDDRFCKICTEVNRYQSTDTREKEGDILELVDNFGMLLSREDRIAYTPAEFLIVMENNNLKGKDNRYIEEFKEFVMEAENVECLGVDKTKLLSRWQKKMNTIPRYDVAQGINLAIENRKEARRLYIDGKKIERDKDGYRTFKQQISAEKRLQEEIAKDIQREHKFLDLIEEEEEE